MSNNKETDTIIYQDQVYQREVQPHFEAYRPVDSIIPKRVPTFKWKGPRIKLADWVQALAFMAWVNKEDRSEAQLRLFVMKDKIVPWAFPQEKGTGMTTVEIENEDQQTQTNQLLEQGGYNFGTVHSHCNSSAFQSSTDKENEENQDGIHITIGKFDSKEKYDIHYRFYYFGVKYEDIPLEWFFDVGPKLEKAIAAACDVFGFTSNDAYKRILTRPLTEAEFTANDAFPEQWRNNLVQTRRSTYHGSYQYSGGSYSGSHEYREAGLVIQGGVLGTVISRIRNNPARFHDDWLSPFKDCSLARRTKGPITQSECLGLLRLAYNVNQSITPAEMTMAFSKKKIDPPSREKILKEFKAKAEKSGYDAQSVNAISGILVTANDIVESATDQMAAGGHYMGGGFGGCQMSVFD